MDKVKDLLWKSILKDIENSSDEKLKNNIKAFKSKKDLIEFVKFYSNYKFDDMKRIASLAYWIRKQKYHINDERLLGTKTKAMPDDIYLKCIEYVKKIWGYKITLA